MHMESLGPVLAPMMAVTAVTLVVTWAVAWLVIRAQHRLILPQVVTSEVLLAAPKAAPLTLGQEAEP